MLPEGFKGFLALLATAAVVLGAVAAAEAGDIPAPRGEALSYDANPSRTNVANEPAVFGPLEQAWTQELPGATGQPLIVDGRVLVTVADGPNGATIRALDPDTGEEIWSADVPQRGRIAAGDGVVVSHDRDGQVMAFRVADGRPLWQDLSPEPANSRGGGVVVHDGVAYVGGATNSRPRGYITARRVRTGRVIWSTVENAVAIDPFSRLAIDRRRIYVSDDCGAAIAFSLDTGKRRWHRDAGSGTCFGADATVSGKRLYTDAGETYDAASGADRPDPPLGPEAVDRSYGFAGDGRQVSGFGLRAAKPRWSSASRISDQLLEPLVVGGTIYTARHWYFGSESTLIGRERRSGEILFQTDLPYPGDIRRGFDPGIAAGAEHLYVAQGMEVTAMRPLLDPPPRGLDLLAQPEDLLAREFSQLSAGLGENIRDREKRVELRANRFPYGDEPESRRVRTDDDGVARFRERVRRNTRFRTLSAGAGSNRVTVYAYPQVDAESRVDPDSETAVVDVTIARVTKRQIRDRRVIAYTGSQDTGFKRRGAATAELTDDGRGQATIRFPLDADESDPLVTVCGRRFPEDGFGRDIGLAGECGKGTVAPAATSDSTAEARGTAVTAPPKD